MLQRKIIILTFVSAALLFGVVRFQIDRVEIQREASIRWMILKAHNLLDAYKKYHLEYPKYLNELSWGDLQDGAKIEMLDSIRYETDGNKYIIEMKNQK
jgi:hypothetical protein